MLYRCVQVSAVSWLQPTCPDYNLELCSRDKMKGCIHEPCKAPGPTAPEAGQKVQGSSIFTVQPLSFSCLLGHSAWLKPVRFCCSLGMGQVGKSTTWSCPATSIPCSPTAPSGSAPSLSFLFRKRPVLSWRKTKCLYSLQNSYVQKQSH